MQTAIFHKEFRSTRGNGLIEKFLAIKRAKLAHKLIPLLYTRGRILDIGSGVCPFFLIQTTLYEKNGLDKNYD